MQFLVIASSVEPLELAAVGDAPTRANSYREQLGAEGKLVLHSHIAGHRAHMWIYNVSGVDELDRVIANDPMSPFITGTPTIYPLTSLERMAERASSPNRRGA